MNGEEREILDGVAERWRRARRVVVLTGAGLSTASGIPDFRSAGGRWSTYQPVTLQEFEASHASRLEYWRYKHETWSVMSRAEPNPGHRALADLAAAERVELLVTQNVDGLHKSSGFPAERLVTIHGTDAQVECLGCGFRGDRAPAEASWRESGEVPSCPTCGDWLKPAVVAFGQSLVMADLQRAFEAAARCDLFLAVGTSLVVSPINQMMLYAADGGAECAILTASETPYDELATWRCAGRLETVLPALRDRVLGGAASSTSS